MAWPKATAVLAQPFLSAYYGWSGAVGTLASSPWLEGVKAINRTSFASPGLALVMLLLHAILGAGLLVLAVRRRR